MNKKGMEMAISTMVIIALSVIILALAIFTLTGGWQKLKDFMNGYSESQLDSATKMCNTQCAMESTNSFCCQNKTLGKFSINCQDSRIKINCNLDCSGVCNG